MADVLTVAEAAQRLGTSRQTIRNLLREGALRGTQGPRGVWRIRPQSVDRFLADHGRLNGGRRRKSMRATLETEVRLLREELAQLTLVAGGQSAAKLGKERDDLRAQVVALEDALAAVREAADLQRRADAERAEMIDSLVAALDAASRADSLRRDALGALEDAVARGAVPGHLRDSR